MILCKLRIRLARAERIVLADSITRRFDDLPFTREHDPMRDLVGSVAQVIATGGFTFDVDQRHGGTTRSFQCVTPKFMFTHDRAPLEQVRLCPRDCIGG